MTTTVQLTSYAGTPQGDVEVSGAPPTRSYDGRCYQRLFCGGAISQCFQKTKACFASLYGRPFPPLSRRQVKEHYTDASLCLAIGTTFGGLFLYAIIKLATDPPSEGKMFPEIAFTALSFCEVVSLALTGEGLIITHKTCKAPRSEENEALLPSS